MTKIKDRAYVVYASEEQAEATRNALSGLEWPLGNGNSLRPKCAASCACCRMARMLFCTQVAPLLHQPLALMTCPMVTPCFTQPVTVSEQGFYSWGAILQAATGL